MSPTSNTAERTAAAKLTGSLSLDALAIIERTHLSSRSHNTPKDGMCAMELVAFVAGESFSDHPDCVCPVLCAFVLGWNDGLPDDERDATIKPILPLLIGTRGSEALAHRRSLMAADWLVRVHTPAWLRSAKLDAQADALAALPEIMSMAQVPSIRGPIEAARRDAYAAWAAASAAARDGAWAEARAAAMHAAWASARGVAGDAAGDAAWASASAAASAAARNSLKETRLALQRSAADLVSRMIEVREPTA